MTDTPKSIAYGHRGLELRTIEDMWRFANYAVKSGMVARSIKTPEQAMIAIEYGAELGFGAMRALAAINVIENIPSLKAEAVTALIRQSGECIYGPEVFIEGEGDKRAGCITFQRRGQKSPITVRFSVEDAKVAKLWEKRSRDGVPSPWILYPEDMLIARAISRAGRRYFSDVLMGIRVFEEVQDTIDVTATVLGEERAPGTVRDPLLEAGLAAQATLSGSAPVEVAPVSPGAPTSLGGAPSTESVTASAGSVEGNE